MSFSGLLVLLVDSATDWEEEDQDFVCTHVIERFVSTLSRKAQIGPRQKLRNSNAGKKGSKKEEGTAGPTLRNWDLSVCPDETCPKRLEIKIRVKVQ